VASIKRLAEEVQQASYALGQQMYAQQGGGPATPPPSGGPAGGEAPEGEVIEGEFREA
jgi:hypothetical protein